jgi:hypothetical protein
MKKRSESRMPSRNARALLCFGSAGCVGALLACDVGGSPAQGALPAHATEALHGAGPGDLAKAPPPFPFGDGLAVVADFERVDVEFLFDTARAKATAHASLTFVTGPITGFPVLDLVPDATHLVLDGVELPASVLALTPTPDGATTLRVLHEGLAAESRHTLVVDYELPHAGVEFREGGVTVSFGFNDLLERNFSEQFAPANFEFDHYAQTVVARVTGDRPHVLLANGQVVQGRPEGDDANGAARDEFRVTFPSSFTTSSPYLFLAPAGDVNQAHGVFHGVRDVPVTVFAQAPIPVTEIDGILDEAKGYLAELEAEYGPYGHDALLVHYEPLPEDDGMEYVGAVETSRGALGHEILHQWFARGVLPADGNAGFLDEAIAQWRDDGYPTADHGAIESTRPEVNLAGRSPYRRATVDDSYEKGSSLLAELDFDLRDRGGLRPVLRRLYAERNGTSNSAPDFAAFFARETPLLIDPIFARYVYGEKRPR